MAHFCGFIKLIFLLLMLAQIPSNETRPLKRNSQTNSDLIAGNEFLKLFMERDEIEKDFSSSELSSSVGNDGSHALREKRKGVTAAVKQEETFDKKSAETGRRLGVSRSLKDKGPKLNQAEVQIEDSKQVVKLVTSGSKIVFLEDYDENDAILDAEARDIDLKKENIKQKNHDNLDDFKVVAVSVSSSSQRGTTPARSRFANTPVDNKYGKITATTTRRPFVTKTSKPPTVTTTARPQTTTSSTKIQNTAGDNFINRSHKSEFSIEEVEPLTMTQQQTRKVHSRHRTYPLTSVSDTLEALDSENSASTNIHNVLAAPLQPSASARSTSMVTTTFHSGQRNMTINHDSNLHATQVRRKSVTTATTSDENEHTGTGELQQQQQHLMTGAADGVIEDQLLPFQTVIYHDTKAGHGPQSRSISYSSISQNVEDLRKWQQTGILAEARRNVSESLKPMPRSNTSLASHQSEPAKFYSQPSKMYSEPSKFYSEPAKVYSEPAKVYGEPEKFYSEPAKVYGQPSKFYSEPAKVYSQPAKVYSEPAKTYWPILSGTTTSTQTASTIVPPTNSPTVMTTPSTGVNIHQPSRKPAIVSRIAFGEAHLISSTTSSTTSTTTTASPLTTTSRTFGSHGQHQYSRTYSNHRNPSSSSTSFNNENSSLSSSSSSASSSSTPSRRILFNLDRLPYDLLNAPEPSTQQHQQQEPLLELQKNKRPQQTSTYQSQQQQQQHKQRHHINPCLESAVSTLFSSSTLSAHPTLQKQHSNQNAKGLPNGDLVKCVAEIAPPSVTTTGEDAESFTTEHSHLEELYTPTPEQNYEIEESVSVMTNGRTHNAGAHSGGVRNSFAQPTTPPGQSQQQQGFKPSRQRTRVHFGTNVNSPTDIQHHHLSQASYNSHTNANADTKNHQRQHNSPDYQQYDDGNQDGNDEGEDESGSAKNNDYDDDGSPANHNNGDDDDSKVAYIVEGQNYRKYRVEEETDDGFIVGEYGVVDHNDGNLRGVRYTADSTINRSLIQKALLTFLKLK